MFSCRDKKTLVQCVEGQLSLLDNASTLTMTIQRESSGVYSVITVTDASSEDIELLMGKYFYGKLANTL